MCMLCVIPPNVIPSREKLEGSALNNPHGFGFAIVVPSENRIHVERTMNADTSINRFLEMRKKYPEGYAMWHARYATHGSTTVENCHPFQVGVGNTQTYLAHNGMLPIDEPIGDDRSDTRIFAEELLPAIGGVASLDNPFVMGLLEDFTSGSKVAVLTIDPVASKQCYIIHEEKGWRDDTNVWWSNTSCYLAAPSNKWYSVNPLDFGLYDNRTASKDDEAFEECNICEAFLPEYMFEEGYCTQCGSCSSCEAYISECMCYIKQDKGVLENRIWAGWGSEGSMGWELP